MCVWIRVAQRDDGKWYLWKVRGTWEELSYSWPSGYYDNQFFKNNKGVILMSIN